MLPFSSAMRSLSSGGDTKLEEDDELDAVVYLFDTSTHKWSRALPRNFPTGRYGHSICLVGTCLYVFGGQVDGSFYSDLQQYDLNKLAEAENRWNTIEKRNSSQWPSERTNHSVVVYNGRMYM